MVDAVTLLLPCAQVQRFTERFVAAGMVADQKPTLLLL